MKTDASGDTLWAKALGGPADELAHSVGCVPGGGYILGGNTFSYGPGVPDSSNAYLIRTNGSGDTLWTRAYGSARNDGLWCARPVPSGGFVAVGWSAQGSSNETFIVRTDDAGDTLWTRHIGGADLDDGLGVEPTGDGGFVIAGFTASYGAGGVDVYLVKTDSLGAVQWYRTFGGPQWDFGHSIRPTADGGFIIGGYTYSFGPGTTARCNAYLIKTDGNGNVGVAESRIDGAPMTGHAALQAWPNPFRHSTTVRYAIPNRSPVRLAVYDATGRLVKELAGGLQNAGMPTANWDGTDAAGGAVSSALYFIRLTGAGASRTARVTVVR
jgi:hypothetical protein